MNAQMVEDLSAQVQRNCHISDARHGGDYAMCTFLMMMREYYRWEKALPFGASLPKQEVGEWLARREQLWDELGDAEYAPLRLDGEVLDPFDTERVNDRLGPYGLVYGAGMGRHAKAHFFLGRLQRRDRPGGCAVLISDREYARDLAAPPAMCLGNTIYIRRESLRRMLWEKLEGWRWARPDNALGRAFACYPFEDDLDAALDAMADIEIQAALLHEMGEYQAGEQLGEDWNRMLLDLAGTPAELMARSVRDHLADCSVTLPALTERAEAASIHFYLGNLTHLRREMFPSLDRAYGDWLATGSVRPLRDMARVGRGHWRQQAERMLAAWRRDAAAAPESVATVTRTGYL